MRVGLKCDRIVLSDKLFCGYVYLENGMITEVSELEMPCDLQYDFTGKYLAPGLIDLHTHGAGGYPFIECTPEDVAMGCDFHLKHGTTTILPTVSAAPFETMRAAVASISVAKQKGMTGANIIGAHMEGPYLSAAQCGAQPPEFITPPIEEEYRALVAEYGVDIARWTYAPESDPEGRFARFLCEHGILASAGHTDAKYPDMKTAEDAGMNLITHLYSCTSTVTRDHGFRSLGVIESAYLLDGLYVEIIADGKHLPPELIRMIVKIKGADKVAVVTDSMQIAGIDVERGELGGIRYIVEDGVCKLYDRSAFAGSIATADRLIRVLTRDCGFDIAMAVRMMSEVPASLLKCKKGSIRCGYDADVIVFDDEIKVTDVFVGGDKKI